MDMVLGILAGGGALAATLAKRVSQQGQKVEVITFTGQPQPENLPEGLGQAMFPLGNVGRIINHMKQKGVTHVVMAGGLVKPRLFDLRPDAKGLGLLAGVVRHHDDALLKAVTDLLNREGFTVLGAQDICPELLAGEGQLGRVKASREHMKDIALGQEVLQAIGALDIGQAVVVKDKVVLGVEAVEGTSALLDRCAALRGEKFSGGVLIKLAKPEQSKQADLPTVGPDTLQQLAQEGYAGIAVSAGSTLILQPDETLKLADDAGLFFIGV